GVGSSNAPLLGSTAAEGLQRIGRTSIATRWRFCGLPQSASCSENFVIPPDVFGQTLSLCSPDGKPARPRENVHFIGVFLDNTRKIVAIWLQSVTSRYTDETLTREISRVHGLGTRSGIAAMAKKLTEGLIKALKPPKHGSSLIWDSEVTGFAIR